MHGPKSSPREQCQVFNRGVGRKIGVEGVASRAFISDDLCFLAKQRAVKHPINVPPIINDDEGR